MIWKGIMLRLKQLLKNKREAVPAAVSDEWWLMVEANYVHNPGWNTLSVWAGDSLYILSSMFAYILTKE